MVADLRCGHFATHSFDDTGWFMAKDGRRAGRQRAMNAMEITMAHTAGNGPDQDLARSGSVDLNILYGERLIRLTKNRGFDSHGCLLSQRLSWYTPSETPLASQPVVLLLSAAGPGEGFALLLPQALPFAQRIWNDTTDQRGQVIAFLS
jgi:hypothetical protein